MAGFFMRIAMDHPDKAHPTSASLQINKRERFKSERDQRHGKSVVRIVRLKPGADGSERPAGPAMEFADRHLPGVIAMLQQLQASDAGNETHRGT
jgi:hypothetical protein